MKTPPRRQTPAIEPPGRGKLAGFFADHRAGLGAIVVAAAAIAAAWSVWSLYGERIRGQPDALLHPGQVTVRGVPNWVTTNLVAEALRDASLDHGLPIDDPAIERKLAAAFDAHPWVRHVVGVAVRHPAAAVIDLECRVPVAMVRWKGGLLGIDAEGIVLPTADFTSEAAAEYPRITGIETSPKSAAGVAWGDVEVEEGAAVAALVGPEWGPLGLVELRPLRGRAGRMWELVGPGTRTILFGSAPGHEQPGEPSAAARIARLKGLGADPTDDRIDLTRAADGDAAPQQIAPPSSAAQPPASVPSLPSTAPAATRPTVP
jgi:hypothetical protein